MLLSIGKFGSLCAVIQVVIGFVVDPGTTRLWNLNQFIVTLLARLGNRGAAALAAQSIVHLIDFLQYGGVSVLTLTFNTHGVSVAGA